MQTKVIARLSLVLLLCNLSGCMATQYVVGKAQVRNVPSDNGAYKQEVQKPAWLFLSPFAFVVDAGTWPIQIPFYVYQFATYSE